jgi:hypothetical protein
MALFRIFSVGGLRCSGVSPMISVAEYPSEGYVLMINKKSARKFCLDCIKAILENGGCQVTENGNSITIQSP